MKILVILRQNPIKHANKKNIHSLPIISGLYATKQKKHSNGFPVSAFTLKTNLIENKHQKTMN